MTASHFTAEGEQEKYEEKFCSLQFTRRIHNQLMLLLVLNTILSVTAFLGNTLILLALRKVTSLHPPSKLLYRNLAATDLCVGLVVEPLSVTSLIAAVTGRWNICRYAFVANYITGYILFGVTLSTITAISLDRLLALLLRLRYRHFVTLKRTYLAVTTLWIVPVVCTTMHFCAYIIFPGLVNCLFRKNFSRSASSTNSPAEPNSPRTVQRSKSTEHVALQKGSI